MPLTLVATPGSSSANAYATVVEATAIADYRLGSAGWTSLSSDQKIQALVTAARDIDSLEGSAPGLIGGFLGERSSDTQALAWPRAGSDYDEDELPKTLVDANIELALSYTPVIAAGTDVLNTDRTNGNVKRKKVDVLETEFFAPNEDGALSMERFPPIVQRLLTPLVLVATDVWGTGDVTRSS